MLRVCLKKLEMGDVFDCRQSVNRSMAKQMVLLDSTTSNRFIYNVKGKLMIVGEDIIVMFLYNDSRCRCSICKE